MADTHTYRTNLDWVSQRKGKLRSPGLPALEVATPPQFPGGHEGTWSPEHLFVASAEACLMTTFLAIAEKSRLSFSRYGSQAEGMLEKTEAGMLMTRIVIYPTVEVEDASQVEKAGKILEKAERHCLISQSMKTEVVLHPTVIVKGNA